MVVRKQEKEECSAADCVCQRLAVPQAAAVVLLSLVTPSNHMQRGCSTGGVVSLSRRYGPSMLMRHGQWPAIGLLGLPDVQSASPSVAAAGPLPTGISFPHRFTAI